MKSKLILSTDRKSASEGEFVEIRWNCDSCPDSLSLTIDSGYKCDTIPVADSGSTRIAMGRSKGKTKITLKGVISGKKESESIDIRIRNIKTGGDTGQTAAGRLKMWKEKLQAGWYVFRAQTKYWWLSQKKWQKALWIALLALWLGLLFASIGNRHDKETSIENSQTAYIIENIG